MSKRDTLSSGFYSRKVLTSLSPARPLGIHKSSACGDVTQVIQEVFRLKKGLLTYTTLATKLTMPHEGEGVFITIQFVATISVEA